MSTVKRVIFVGKLTLTKILPTKTWRGLPKRMQCSASNEVNKMLTHENNRCSSSNKYPLYKLRSSIAIPSSLKLRFGAKKLLALNK